MDQKSKFFSWLALAFRVCIGALFLYAGILKACDPSGFAVAIGNYHILPLWAVNPTAIILPWVEILLGTALLLGYWIEGASIIAALLFCVFSFALAFNLIRGLDISCGCFSASPKKINWLYFLRDAGLMLMSIFIFFHDRHLCSLTGWIMSMMEQKSQRRS